MSSKNKKNQNTAVATSTTAPEGAQPIEGAIAAETITAPAAEVAAPAATEAPAPVAETPAKPEVVVIPFVLANQEDLPIVEAFVGVIMSDEGKKKHKSFYQRFKNMITGYTDWKLITEKKYKNLQKLVAEFEALPAEVAAPAAPVAEAPKAEEVAAPVAEAAAEPAAEVAAEEVKA